jgi:hypothetical protein
MLSGDTWYGYRRSLHFSPIIRSRLRKNAGKNLSCGGNLLAGRVRFRLLNGAQHWPRNPAEWNAHEPAAGLAVIEAEGRAWTRRPRSNAVGRLTFDGLPPTGGSGSKVEGKATGPR